MIEFHSKHNTSSNASGLRQCMSEPMTRGINCRVWDVTANNIQYQYSLGHTLSLYLRGGYQTFRHDKPHIKGQPGRLCLMPQDHLSRWNSPEPIRIAHLYLPDQLIRQEAERHLDIDSRLANIKDLIYEPDADLSHAMMGFIRLIKSDEKIEPIATEQALHRVIVGVLEKYCDISKPIKPFNYGLSQYQRRWIKHFIRERLQQKLTLEELASQLHLSPFHFARMFKQSFGDSPARYIIRQRIELSKALLLTRGDISAVALECGFSDQSHLIKYFKKHVAVTPAVYRKMLMAR